MPILQRFSAVKNGGVVFIGNTLGLSKIANALNAGELGSIGAFISPDTTLRVGNFPFGTTLDYLQNGSSAVLDLPTGSTVLYAELVWGGLFRSTNNNISALINNSVEFITPSSTNSIAPDALTAQTFNITNDVTVGFYVRSANVTAIVKAAGNGTYQTGKVPALIEAIDSRTADTNHAGWTLAVVYENASLPLRDLTLWCGGAVVSPSEGSTGVPLTGFITPDMQPITGKLFVSAQEGDAVLTGDQMFFGETVGSLSLLSGPNNPADNFFCSQINGEDGLIVTSGTFGTRNADAENAENIDGGRQGWDITAVDVSPLLSPGMTTAITRFTTNGDLYVANCLALEIDSKGAHLELYKVADRAYAAVGEQINYTLSVVNNGSIQADTIFLEDLLPDEATLVPDSIKINGVPYAGTLPVTFGPLAAQDMAKITFSVTVNTFPAANPVFDIVQANYTFTPFPGYTVSETSDSNYVGIYIVKIDADVVKSVNKAVAESGEELLYTSVVTNNSSLPLTGIVFTDTIPVGTTYVEGSVVLNGVSQPFYNPSTGFPLPNLLPEQSATVTFRVTIQ